MASEIFQRLIDPVLLLGYKTGLIAGFNPPLELYFQNLSEKRGLPEISDPVKDRIAEVIFRNTLMADILDSQEFLEILQAEKSLRGEAKVGVVDCIDGRLSIIHQFGRVINVKEIAGSLLGLSDDGRTITDRRFIGILEQTADQDRELLEIVTAHTSLRHSEHRCGRITAGVASGEFEGEVDQVAWQEAEKRAAAIENKYNQILVAKGKPSQTKVAVSAMIDTDTMGLIFNFNRENQLSTTDLTRRLAYEIETNLGKAAGGFASMKDTFAEPANFLDYSKKVLTVTDYLMKGKFGESGSEIVEYMKDNFHGLSEQQQQALLFTICRTIANQYVTGLASEEEFAHPYLEHYEGYMVVSPHGKALGGFDMRQSFGSVPASREEMLSHVKTKLGLLDRNQGEQPYILFLSTPVNLSMLSNPDISLVALEDAARVYFLVLFDDNEIRRRLEEGSLIIVPILIDENNRRPLEVRDYSIFLN